MRAVAVLLCVLSIPLAAWTAHAVELPPTALRYEIDVTVEPTARALSGTEKIVYTHHGEATASIPLHLYLNAFSHERTTWMQGASAKRLDLDTHLGRYGDDIWGGIRLVSVARIGGEGSPALTWSAVRPDDHNPLDRSLVEVDLGAPLQPGETVELEVTFEARLPVPIARTGAIGDFALVAQWFPKVAVYEAAGVRRREHGGWAAHQFHGPTEFYADYADFQVDIRAPAGWAVLATGAQAAESPEGVHRFRASAVHDFAFAVGRSLSVETRSHRTPSGREIAVTVATPLGLEHQGERMRAAVVGALDVFSARIGPYPYATLTLVLPPFEAYRTSGMEYPTFITGLAADPIWDLAPDLRLPELVAIHELAHQYFYGLIASNEVEEAFLDEGFATYWEGEAMESIYGDAAGGSVLGRAFSHVDARRRSLRRSAGSVREPVRKRPSYLFYPSSWVSQIYTRPALTLRTAEALFGQSRVDAVFAHYYRQHVFGHPDTEDFLQAAGQVGGSEFEAFLAESLMADRSPDFAVVALESVPFRPPRHGAFHGDSLEVALEQRREQMADRSDGRVVAEVVAPGFVGSTSGRDGAIEVRALETSTPAQSPPDAGLFESTVVLTGPGWRTLPVWVEFRFTDGAVVRDRWDGRASWRRYRFIRGAKLTRCHVDPEEVVSLDATQANNSAQLEADGLLTVEWALWTAAAAQWLASGWSLWL